MGADLASGRLQVRSFKSLAEYPPDGQGRSERPVRRLGGDEEVTLAAGAAVLKIGCNRLADIDRERHAVVLPALTADQDLSRPPSDVLEPDRDHFLCAQTKPGHQQQHRVVATADPIVATDRVDQPPDLVGLQMTCQGTGTLFCSPRNAERHATGAELALIDEVGLLGESKRGLWNAMLSSVSNREGRLFCISIRCDGPMSRELGERAAEPAVAGTHGRRMAEDPCLVRQSLRIHRRWVPRPPGRAGPCDPCELIAPPRGNSRCTRPPRRSRSPAGRSTGHFAPRLEK